MLKFIRTIVIGLLASLFMLLPGHVGQEIPAALAISGATMPWPSNGDFEAPAVNVGNGPTNYDFSSDGSGWSKIGTVTYPGDTAKLVGSAMITSSYDTSSTSTQGIKIRYKYPASGNATIAVYNSAGSAIGTENFSCIDCTNGEWVDKYLRVYPSYLGGVASESGSSNRAVQLKSKNSGLSGSTSNNGMAQALASAHSLEVVTAADTSSFKQTSTATTSNSHRSKSNSTTTLSRTAIV